MNTEPRAFVAGATGLTGREVVAALRARDVATYAHVRPDSARRDAWRTRFAALRAEVDETPWSLAEMKATLRRLAPTVVFALLGTTRRRGARARKAGREETYESVDYGLSALLLQASVQSAAEGPGPRFVYLSSMGVGPKARNPYLSARRRMEKELQESGLPWVVARPSFILGARDEARPLERLGAGITDALLTSLALVGGTRTAERYRSQSARELAHALVHLALAEDTAGRIYESDTLRTITGDLHRSV